MSDNKKKDTDYLFLSTMLRAREARLLTSERLTRIAEAEDMNSAAKLLTDCDYPDLSGMGLVEVEKALSERRATVFDEVGRIAPEPAIVEFFRLKYDYHNVKVLIKARGVGAGGESMLSVSGRVPPNVMSEAFNSEDYRFLPVPIKRALEEAGDMLQRTENPQLADFCVDRAYFAELLDISGRCCGRFLTEYARILIDCANLRAAVRTLRMGKDADFLRAALVPGGSVGVERLVSCAFGGEGLTTPFAMTPLEKCAELGAQAAAGGQLSEFERACDNAVTAFLGRAKMVTFGPEQLVAFLASLEGEIVAVRMVLSAKLTGMSAELLKERLRDTYA